MGDQSTPTQPNTQPILDPRRLGRNNSGLSADDISNVMCILHPTSPAAFRIVRATAERTPEHVLQNGGSTISGHYAEPEDIEEADTFILNPAQTFLPAQSNGAYDLALRFDSVTKSTCLGFCFGRNEHACDIVFTVDTAKRVSNLHFRIFVNNAGVIMIEDLSTNGTLVDNVHLRGKNSPTPATRMLNQGSTIEILSTQADEKISFIVRFPARDDFAEEYLKNLEAYLARAHQAEEVQLRQQGRARTALPRGERRTTEYSAAKPSLITPNYTYGMHWNGGGQYNVIGVLGKGAFATVYKLATAMDGQILAAKELEKKRFVKNGRLDQRLENEMQIMKDLRHPNIVQYIDYHDIQNHLYIIMEYVPCGDLQKFLEKNRILREPLAKIMSRQILGCLAYLHRKDVTHRDIKPDNILIASENPFVVKLSDFGLSKVVKNNETFLKTFCGTLLYCAPEVFPHYDTHVEQKGIKRRRSGSSQKRFHSYSSSVDVWSYAAVLWFAMCGKPPFEGVVDATGRGMFDRIMGTSLDTSPLKAVGVSNEAIDLLLRMLNTDPSKRPTERECLQHPWLNDGTELLPPKPEADLSAIPEEDEEVWEANEPEWEGIQDDTEAGAEKEFSQLSIRGATTEEADFELDEEEEVDFSSQDFEFLDPRASKRIRQDILVPRNQIRDPSAMESSPEISMESIPAGHDGTDESFVIPTQAPPRRLFGEIGQSALQSSGVLDVHTQAALHMPQRSFRGESTSANTSFTGNGNISNTSRRRTNSSHRDSFEKSAQSFQFEFSHNGDGAAASLLGAESEMRELNMESPQYAASPGATGNDPSTPKSPESPHTPPQEEPSSLPEEVTPKPRQTSSFKRQFHLGIPEHMLIEPTTSITGYPTPTTADIVSLPPTEAPSLNGEASDLPLSANEVHLSLEGSFVRPPPCVGRLRSTDDSFKPITLMLNQRLTTWGRHPSNTIRYPDITDVRIPKMCFSIHFQASGIDEAERSGEDWRDLPDLIAYIKPHSKIGLLVNSIPLHLTDKQGRVEFGRIRHGDVVTVFHDERRQTCLKFICEFYHGAAALPRDLDNPNDAFKILVK